MEINDSIKELLNSDYEEDQRIAMELLKDSRVTSKYLHRVEYSVLRDYIENAWDIWWESNKIIVAIWKET